MARNTQDTDFGFRRVPLDGKHGFMLALAKSINELSENLEAVTNDLVRMFSALAGGDFTSRRYQLISAPAPRSAI